MKRRLDQLLASSGLGSRSEVKELIQLRRVTVAGVIERNPAT